jgi:O-6-methylguanine DNA methyltransferase
MGRLLLTGKAGHLTGAYLETQANIPRVGRCVRSSCAALERAKAQLALYFDGHAQPFDVPAFSQGTRFQRDVWQALCAITFGETRSYEAIAASIGRPRAIRAVGTAIGQNPFAIIVPCHRVIAKNGGLAGYAGGLECKRWLLDHEQRVPQAPL